VKQAVLVTMMILAASIGLKAADAPFNTATLKDIKTFFVVIEDLADDAPGLTANQIRTSVELRLRQAGIRLADALGGVAYLYVQVNTTRAFKPFDNTFGYNVHVAFVQRVKVIQSGVDLLAETWSVDTLQITQNRNLGAMVRSSVNDHVDEFINAYLSVNPK